MNPPYLPPWGCPWHGLVKGGQLALPNGQTMTYPQPSGEPWQQGSTALLARPGLPVVERTPDEQAADTAAGRQWWNKAIIAGGYLYGQLLNGWIYIDPNGDRWLVTTTLSTQHLSGGTCSVTLARFGVLGGAPQTHTYIVTVPDMGQGSPVIDGTTGTRISRYHTSPTGSGAVFEVAVEFSEPYERYWRWRPAGWLEVTLVGAGSACTVSLVVHKRRAQTLGSYVLESPPLLADSYYLNRQPDGSRLVEQQPGGDTYQVAAHNIVSAPERSGFTGWVVGMLYDAAGQLQTLTLDIEAETQWSDTPLVYSGPAAVPAGESFSGAFHLEQNWISSLTLTYRLGGTALGSYTLQIAEASTETLSYANDTATRDYSVQVQCTPGGDFSTATSAAAQDVFMGGLWTYGFYCAAAPVAVSQVQEWWFETGAVRRYLQPCPYRYSNALYGLCLWGQPQSFGDTLSRVDYLGSAISPDGEAALLPLVLDKYIDPGNFDQFAYASRCPVTGATTRAEEPVCYV